MIPVVPRVSIGLPTYDRPEFLARALDCFRQQTFTDFELVISDNASPDQAVGELCQRYARLDPRFRYLRQPSNIGGEQNFWFVYDQAKAPLFLWASDDDLWPAEFLEKGVSILESNPHASAWFCQVANINLRGDIIRLYPSFKRFQSTASKYADLARFLWEPEIMGKANLIYSIFRRDALSEAVDLFRQLPSHWGSDMNFVYAFLCRSNLVIDDQLVLQKRVPVSTLNPVSDPRLELYPRDKRATYFANYRRAAAGSGYWQLTAGVLVVRSAYDHWYSGRLREDWRYWGSRAKAVVAGVIRRVWRAFRAFAPARKE